MDIFRNPLFTSLSNTQFLSGYHCVNDARQIFQQEELAIQECQRCKGEFAIEKNSNSYVYYETGLRLKLFFLLYFLLFKCGV